jgi:hypothetical protein
MLPTLLSQASGPDVQRARPDDSLPLRDGSRMRHFRLTDSVRQQVADAFAQIGMPAEGEVRETILIRDGSYCGRRFEAEEASAIWFVEENQIKVFGADGSLVRVIQPREASQVTRAAA